MIQMISGATRIGDRLMRPENGAFAADPAVESRLVNAGVAEYCGEIFPTAPAAVENEGSKGENAETAENGTDAAAGETGQLEDLSKADLVELAKGMGIDCAKLRTRSQIIQAINCAEEDAPPALGAEAPIV